MSHDGLPVRAVRGARAARTDRRASASRFALLRTALPAAAIAGATALVFAACSTGSSGSSGAVSSGAATTSAAASTGGSTEASASSSAAAAASGGPLAVIFQPINNSQVLGGAVITDQPDGTATVEIGIGSTGATDGMPATLQQGACATMAGASGSPSASGSPAASGGVTASAGASAPASAAASSGAGASAGASAAAGGSGAPSGSAEASVAPSPISGPPFQLTPLAGGASTTTIATTTSALLAEPFSIVIGQSATATAPVACADVTTNSVRVPTASAVASMLPSALPSLEVGASPSSS